MAQDIRNTRAWALLSECHAEFDENPREYEGGGLTLDLTTAGMTAKIMGHLQSLAAELDWGRARDDLFAGTLVNVSENRPALHTALRAAPASVPAAVREEMENTRGQMNTVMAKIVRLHPSDIIHVGIGGSGLGPLFLSDYFEKTGQPGSRTTRIHLVNNADPAALQQLMTECNRLSTVLIIASKSFTTEDVMLCANVLADWLADNHRMFAITGETALANKFGIESDQCVNLPDWLGGRFSIWGGVSLPVMLRYGTQKFEQFLSGARQMDGHFCTAPAQENLPLLLSLTHLWQSNFMHCGARAVIPYASALSILPAYIQQLEMESNGKTSSVPTCPIIFGGVGTTVQHSFMQWLHQGSAKASVDFVLPLHQEGNPTLAQFMRNNALAQSAALAHGAPPDFPGGRPSNLIFMEHLSPAALGALIALYEHKTYLDAHFWGINAFDQPGVELGKRLARGIQAGRIPRSTPARLARYKSY